MRRPWLTAAAGALTIASLLAGACNRSSTTATAKAKATAKVTTSTTAKPKPLTVDACTTLTNAEVTTFANASGGEYKVSPPLVTQPVPSYFIGQSGGTTTTANVDPDRYCTWVFQQKTASGATADDATVEVHIRRIAPPSTAARPPGFPAPQPECTLFSSTGVRDLPGLGDRAQSTGGIGAVVKGDVCSEVTFAGAEGETKPADPDAAVVAVLRRLLVTVGNG
jgi:hypothetical protein